MSGIQAQDLSIEQALALAQDRPIQEAVLQTNIEEINLKIQRSKRLPQLYGDANVQRNLIIPITPVPAIAFDPNAPEGAIMPLRFATDWSAKAGLQLSLDIFNPQSKANVAAAAMQYDKTKLRVSATQIDFKNQILDVYAQTYLAQEQLDVALQNALHYQNTLQILEARYQAGRLSTIEWNKAQQKMLELNQNGAEAAYVLKNKYVALAQYIDIAGFDNLSTPIDALLPMDKQNLEMQQLTLDANWKQKQWQLSRLEILPKFTFNGYLGGQHFSNDFKPFDHKLWYGNSYINITMRVPITEWYENKLRQQQYRQEFDLAQLKLEDHQQTVYTLNQQKSTNIIVLQSKIQTTEQTVALIKDNIAILESQVQEGKVLITELNSELENLLKTLQQLWQTKYDLLQTKIND